MIVRTVSALVVILGLCSPSAHAKPPTMAGNWSFKAWIGQGCEFTGIAHISPVPDADGTHACELTANQVCGIASWTVRQTCTAETNGNHVSIRSEIAEHLGDDASESYLPDNFLLTIDTTKRMLGALHSVSVYKAVWVRDESAVS